MKGFFCILFLVPLILVFQNCGGAFDSQILEEQSSVENRYPLSGDVSESPLVDRLEPTQGLDSQTNFKTSTSNQTVGDESYDLYLSPTGADSNSGLSSRSPLKTLSKAQQILHKAQPRKNVRILVKAGVYYGQSVVWTYVNSSYSLTIEPESGTVRPVFIGCETEKNCRKLTWFNLVYSRGTKSNINIKHIHVENYSTAISFGGSRGDANKFNSHNLVYGCYFINIGNVFSPNLEPSTAALRLVNSKNNTIRNNHFINIINTVSPGLIHAVYAAHYSGSNDIVYNRFQNISGSSVKVRDESDDNTVAYNKFSKIDYAAYDEWYCDKLTNSACTKPKGECPSQGNWFKYNTIGENRDGRAAQIFTVRGPDRHKLCRVNAKRRLRTAANMGEL